MSEPWKVDVAPVPDGQQLDPFLTILRAQQVWGWLTKPQRTALAAAYPNDVVEAHPNTLRALEAHGLVKGLSRSDLRLTAAAKMVVHLRPVKP
jgi:hypothetical protein